MYLASSVVLRWQDINGLGASLFYDDAPSLLCWSAFHEVDCTSFRLYMSAEGDFHQFWDGKLTNVDVELEERHAAS